jgi:hypothetical protein
MKVKPLLFNGRIGIVHVQLIAHSFPIRLFVFQLCREARCSFVLTTNICLQKMCKNMPLKGVSNIIAKL